VVDGRPVGKLDNGGKIDVELPPGQHEVWVTVDWCRSPKLLVNVSHGQPVKLLCGANAHPLLVLLYITVWKNDYIWLKQV
jgi:hypothetical protein